MKHFFVAVSLTFLTCGCHGGSRSSSPTSPTAPPAAALTYTVSGVVVAVTPTGLAPIEGVQVQANLGRSATTDHDGLYSISGLPANASVVISASKTGYDTDTRNLTITGDTRLDMRLVPRAPRVTYTLSGVVFELTSSGRAALDGVQVYCDSCGEDGHTFTYSDTTGFYSFSGVNNGSTPLLVRKAGYSVIDTAGSFPDGTGWAYATVSGDTRFDIQLVRR